MEDKKDSPSKVHVKSNEISSTSVDGSDDSDSEEDQLETKGEEEIKRLSPESSPEATRPDDDSRIDAFQVDHVKQPDDRRSETPETSRRYKKDAATKRVDLNITVETPEGHKIVIRARPDQTFRYLLEVCSRRLHISPNDHYFVHNFREIFESTKIHSTGITQNDVVKLFKGKKTILQRKIRVIVKVRDIRVGSIFKDTDNLWNIIKTLLAKDVAEDDLVPVVLYNKEEFIGVEKLSRVRLRDIGITTGACTLKFLQLKQEDLNLRGVKMDDDENAVTTLESLEQLAAGPTQDAGVHVVKFKQQEPSLSLLYIGDRKALAFKVPDMGAEEVDEILKDEYFDLTAEEIAYFYQETLRKQPDLEKMNTKTALTLIKGEIDDHRARADYEETMIRVQLPDKTVLQGIFLPDETINDVKEFVRKYVKERDMDFEIYRTDPQNYLSPEARLRDLNCVPCAKLYLGGFFWMSSSGQILQDEINLVTSSSADEVALILRGESLEQFFGSFDSMDHGKSGASYASYRKRSKKQSIVSFLRKSSGGLHRFRQSIGKGSVASTSSGMSRPRRTTRLDPRQIASIARSSRADIDSTEFEKEGSPEVSVNPLARRRETVKLDEALAFRRREMGVMADSVESSRVQVDSSVFNSSSLSQSTDLFRRPSASKEKERKPE